MPVLGTGRIRYIRRPVLAIKAPIRALQLPREQQATGPRWTLSPPQTIILNRHKQILYNHFVREVTNGRKVCLSLRFSQETGFSRPEGQVLWATISCRRENSYLVPSPGTPFPTTFSANIWTTSNWSQDLQMFPSSFAAQTWPSLECKAGHIWGPTNCFCRAFLGCGVYGIGIAVSRKWFHGLRIWILC